MVVVELVELVELVDEVVEVVINWTAFLRNARIFGCVVRELATILLRQSFS